MRERAGLEVRDFGAPIDVLWMKLAKRPGDPTQSLGRFNNGHILVMLDRGDYWQCGFVIPKGGYDALKAQGIEALHDGITAVAPFFADRVDELKTWDDVSLLTVTIDRLETWHQPGLLCIGDAAHAMSPIGGVGINLAIQDAVAAANILRTAARRHTHRIGPRRSAATPRVPGEGDASDPGLDPEQRVSRTLHPQPLGP